MPHGRVIRITVTREDFAALVADLRAELAAAGPMQQEALRSGARIPAAFAGRPWTAATASIREAAGFMAYTYWTLSAYAKGGDAAAARWQHARFPPYAVPAASGAAREWRVGDLAIWAASRNPDHGQAGRAASPGFPVRPRTAARKPKDYAAIGREGRGARKHAREFAAAVQFAAALVRADPAVTLAETVAAAGQAGVPMWPRRGVMDEARATALPAVLEGIAPAHPSGHATAAEIAAAFGVSAGRVRAAMERGEIRAARDGRRWLADPARLRYRREIKGEGARGRTAAPAPADKDHPAAVPLPGDIKEGTT